MENKDKIWINLMEFGHRIGCHQMPERSFFYKNYQYPICARCTGVIIGELIAVLFLIFKLKINIIISFFLLMIMGFDWFIQFINILKSNNIRRLLTGICGRYWSDVYLLLFILLYNYICSQYTLKIKGHMREVILKYQSKRKFVLQSKA